MCTLLSLINANIITPVRVIYNGSLQIKEGKIVSINCHTKEFKNSEVIDVEGKYLSPGFIDIHTHGGGGYDFMDGTVEAILKGSQAHLEYGTTSIVPTTLTSTLDNLYETLDNFKIAKSESAQGPHLIGIHLEGPYFDYDQRGAQDPKYIRDPSPEEYMKILNYSDEIVRWTIAPEKPGALELADILSEKDIIPSIGHSNATHEEVLQAYEHGYNLVTHLYSGMSMTRRINAYRHAGIVESSYLIDDLFVELIADGIHLPASLLQLAYKTKGPDKICLITDSMRGAGMPEGEYILGNKETGQMVIVEEGVAKLQNKQSFAGSVATADRLIRTMIDSVNIPIHEAIKMLTLTPARVMKIDKRKGSIQVGKDADLIVFDNQINVSKVFVNGELVINKEVY